MKILLIYLIYLFHFSCYSYPVQASCGSCPALCNCSTASDGLCLVDCSALGLAEVPSFNQSAPTITSLNLSDNNLTKIFSNSFNGLSNLINLYLQINSISVIEGDAFSGLASLKVLNLSRNHLRTLPDQLFYLPLQSMSLSHNNWSCDCSNARFQAWLTSRPERSSVECSSPSHLANDSLSTIVLTDCSEMWVSCFRNKTFVLWDQVTSSSAATLNETSCKATCFAGGFHYALLHSTSCFCANQRSAGTHMVADTDEWRSCSQACALPQSDGACYRKVARGNVVEGLPVLQFSSGRNFRRKDEISVEVKDMSRLTESFVWNFNDSSPERSTNGNRISHKYGATGSYQVTVTAVRGSGRHTERLTLLIEDDVDGFEIACPAQTTDDAISLPYFLKQGSNPSLTWRIDNSTDAIKTVPIEPARHLVSGSVAFHEVGQTLITKTAPKEALPSQNFVLLFPGMWIVENGLLNSWEVVLKRAESIRLLLYRPICSDPYHLLSPGCLLNGKRNPFASCSRAACEGGKEKCESGKQFCYFNLRDQHCRSPLIPCNWNFESGNTSSLRHADVTPVYEMVEEFYVNLDGSQAGLYQILIDDEVNVNADDVIAVGFEASSIPKVDDLPLACINTSYSEWRQSALLFSVNSSGASQLRIEREHLWLDGIWCDVRAHYSEGSSGVKTLPVDQTTPGYATYVATSLNQVSSQSKSCSLLIGEGELQLKIVHPHSSVVDGVESVYVERGATTNLTVEVRTPPGQERFNFTLSESNHGTSSNVEEYQAHCDVTNPINCAKVVDASVTVTGQGDSSVSLLARSASLRTTRSVNLITEERITGARVIGANVSRVLLGTYKEFSYTTDTGSEITADWIIDGLTQFRLTRNSLNVLFRTTTSHQIQTVISNHISVENISSSFDVEQMNKLHDVIFTDTNKILKTGESVTFAVKVNVDEDIDATVKWYIDNNLAVSHPHAPPYTSPRPVSSIKEVVVTDHFTHTFTSAVTAVLKVEVCNDYDIITSEDRSVEVRNLLASVELVPVSEMVNNQSIEFTIKTLPSPTGTSYSIQWGDTLSDDVTESTVMHTFLHAGRYDVIMVADNQVSNVTTRQTIMIYNKISGLSLSSDQPTELNYNTTITAMLVTGRDSSLQYTFHLSDSDIIENTTQNSVTHQYLTTGEYNVTVIAFNPANQKAQSIRIQVFQLTIDNVIVHDDCYATNTSASVEAVLPVQSYHLFQFRWSFGNGSSEITTAGHIANHTYNFPSNYSGKIWVRSLLSSKEAEKTFVVCVQSPITAVAFNSTKAAEKTGMQHVFHYDVIGSNDASVEVKFGDGETEKSSGRTGSFRHSYSAAGNYSVRMVAENLVSEKEMLITVIVQDPIQIINITTSSDYHHNVPVDELITFRVHYIGTDATSIGWNFFNGSGVFAFNARDGLTFDHSYAYPDNDNKISVNVSNLVSSDVKEIAIHVYSRVGDVVLTSLPRIVVVGTSVWLNATAADFTRMLWRISPTNSSNESWTHVSESSSYLHAFTQQGRFNVTVKSENEASAKYASAEILVAESISGRVRINPLNLTREYGAVDESSMFAVTLDDGSRISSSTSGLEEFITFKWKITESGAIVYEEADTSIITFLFAKIGAYVISVNVTNTVTSSTFSYTAIIIERIENVTMVKEEPPQGAIATGEEVTLIARVKNGTELSYSWNPPSESENGERKNVFRKTYSSPGTYHVSVEVSNQLGSERASYELSVQDPIIDVVVTHLDPVQPFYVAHYENTSFRASVSSGTNVLFTWSFRDKHSTFVSDPTTTVDHTYNWNFTKVSTYWLMLNASNQVSWDSTNITVIVMEPVSDLQLILAHSVILTGDDVMINATVANNGGAKFSIDFGDGSTSMSNDAMSTSFSTSHIYSSDGTYNVSLLAHNNASRDTASETIYVRDAVTGLEITGSGSKDFVRNDVIYNLTAEVRSGTVIEYNWTVVYSNDAVERWGERVWPLLMSVEGAAVLAVRAFNGIQSLTKTINVTVQIPPQISVKLVTRDPSIYVNQTVEVKVTYKAGSDVKFCIDFGDGNVITNSTDLIFNNVYIDPGVYVINVTSYNEVGTDSEMSKITVGELLCVQPKLSFVGSAATLAQFYRSRQVHLETEIDTFGCTTYVLSYRWHFYRQDNCDQLIEENKVTLPFSTAYSASSPLLALPPLTLTVGKYCVTNTATYLKTPLSDTVATTLEILSTPLTVFIAGGTERHISDSATVTLDASSSFDPDQSSDEVSTATLQFRWTCSSRPRHEDGSFTQFTGPTPCFQDNTDGIVTLPQDSLLPGYEYNHTVHASKPGKSEVAAWQSIVVVRDSIPTVTITCHSCRSTFKINSGHHLTLMGSCDGCRVGDVRYLWEASRRNSSAQEMIPFTLNKESTTTGNSSRYLVVRAFALALFYEYEFRLTITSQGTTGFSKLILYANKPPEGGTCSMTYDGAQVYVLETMVNFECVGWVDDDLSPLIYTIIAFRYNQGEELDDFQIYKGTSSTQQAYLPLGSEYNQYDLIIQIMVEDELGASTIGFNRTLKVQLKNQDGTLEWLRDKISGELAELQRSSNPQVVADYAAGCITVLNQDSETRGFSADEQELNSRKEIRNNITQSVTSLSTNTFAEIQQVAAVFKQCTKIPSEFQDEFIHNISLAKLYELTKQMPNYVSVATQTSFLAVTNDLVGIVSYMVDSINYPVYFGGLSSSSGSFSTPSLSAEYRQQIVDGLLDSAVQLTDNVLEGKVEGEEPIFLNASAFSSIGGRTTPATMNSSIQNDGCHMNLPEAIFSNISRDTEIFFIFFVSQQNPYTFGYLPSSLGGSLGIANISTRVPSLQFKYTNHTVVEVNNLQAESVVGMNASSRGPIKMVMAPSERIFIEQVDTKELAELWESGEYDPRSEVNFQYSTLRGLTSIGVEVTNTNTDADTAVHIMVVFDKIASSNREEARPYIDVFFHSERIPNSSRFASRLRLYEATVARQADHRAYTFFIDPMNESTTLPSYYLNVTSYFESLDVLVGIGVYYSSCQYFDIQNQVWSSSGVYSSEEALPSTSVCYSNHLTSFGSFVISPPNIVHITDIVDVNFSQNPIAIITVVVVVAIYLIFLILSCHLDRRDIASVSVVPLCGPNHSHKYEITVKTSPGIGSGTTANVGVCVYGYEARTGSRHLQKEGAFQRGAVDVFQIACDVSLGTVYKLKIWHDNTGLDPGWNLSRVMVRDLQNDHKYYFLIDSWLQVYPDDVNETCLQKTVRAASDEEMSDFSTKFGTQLSYGWEDAHLWLSLIERPPRSSFTRAQRATSCVTLLLMFMLFSAMWYQDVTDSEDLGSNLARDIAVGAIVSVMVFPANLIIVFLFKKSKTKRHTTADQLPVTAEVTLARPCARLLSTHPIWAMPLLTTRGLVVHARFGQVPPMTSWIHKRAQTAQTIEILDEILDGRSRKSTLSRMFPLSHLSFADVGSSLRHYSMKKSEELHELAPSQLSNQDTGMSSNQDTGISTGVSSVTSINSGVRLRKRSTTYPHQFDDDGDGDDYYTDTFASDVSLYDGDSKSIRPSNLRRTRKGKFQSNMLTSCDDAEEENDDGSFDEIDDGVTVMSFNRRRSSQCSSIGDSFVDVTPSTRNFNFPRSLPMYIAYLLCFVASSFSILYIILYGHSFGVERAKRWLLSMLVALLESFLIIEPMKVVFLAIYIAMFASQKTPEQDDNIVDEPLLQTDEACSGRGLHKPSKIRPPGGFALEQCKDQARKSAQARKYLIRFGVHLLFFWSVVAFCIWDRGFMSYWSSRSVNTALFESTFEQNSTYNLTFKGIRSDADMWAWLTDVFEPHVMNKEASFYDSSNNFNRLLGKARIRQQRRRTADRCPASTSSSWRYLDPGFPCLSYIRDTASYYPGWSVLFNGDNATWFHSPAMLTRYGYWGIDHVYDDSGYVIHLDSATVRSQLDYLRDSSWVDRLTSVCFLEFAHYNPSTYWFTVSVLMFEFDSTGVITPSDVTQTVRLFSPSSAFYLDQLFIILIILIGMFLWSHEVVKLFVRGRTWSGFWKHFNFFNFLINVTTTCICVTFIYKEVYMEEVMRAYKSDRGSFTNFYGIAFICNFLTYISGFLLALLIIKSLKLFRFSSSLCIFEKSLSRVCRPLAAASAMFFVLVASFAQLGYLVFGLHAIADFHDFSNSMYTMMRVVSCNFDPRPCFEVLPLFTIVFFFGFYFGIFIIFCRLFAAVIINGYKATRMSLKFPRYQVPECGIMEFMIQRMKMKLGFIKPKQYRPNVHFEGMSEHSSESSFISLDSLGSCFTPERISQCSEASGISTSDSGLGSHSDHSLSLFDYLTLEQPPSEKPMDDLHLEYLFDRLSSYSVDMMLRKMDRVIKLGDDVHSIESELLEATKRFEQKKVLKKKSEEIARAASSGSVFDAAQGSSEHISLYSAESPNHTPRERPVVSVGGNIDLLLKKDQKIKPVRSSSYVDGEKYLRRNTTSHMREAENGESRKRPHSDEGARVPTKNSNFEGVIKKKTAW